MRDASYTEMLIDNAATASQNTALVDDPVTREAIRLNIIDPLLALSSHEPAPTDAKRGEQRTICEACGRSNIAHDRAVWTEDGSSFCPDCAPTDTQEGMSEAGDEVLGSLFRLRYGPDRWSEQLMFSTVLPKEGDYKEHIPLVRLSALTACQQEVGTLRKGIKEIAEREKGIRDNWTRFEAETGARTLELRVDLEVANDKVERLRKALEEIASDDEHGDYEGVVQFARAALGGQSIE